MHYIKEDVLKILEMLSDESDILDYKESFYPESQYPELIKDVIGMLNCPVQVDEPRIILCGIANNSQHELKGIPIEKWKDDNEYQNLFKCIDPLPHVASGTVEYDKKIFGYFYIYPYEDNGEWVYEVGRTYTVKVKNSTEIKKPLHKYIAVQGSSYVRIGTVNTWLNESTRIKLRKKKQRLDYQKKELLAATASNNQISLDYIDVRRTLALVGAFNEKADADRSFVEKIYGDSFESFLLNLRNLSAREKEIVSFIDSTGIWCCKNHLSILQSISPYFYKDQLVNFLNEALNVSHSIDSLFDKPAESRIRVINREENGQYSKALRRGIADTLAILGNYSSKFPNIEHMKLIQHKLYDFELKVFDIGDWKALASIAEEIPLLAEASPEGFLAGIKHLCHEKPDILKKIVSEDAATSMMVPMQLQIITALKYLALPEEYFAQAVMLLSYLGKYSDKFVDAVCDVVFPAYPLTYANVDKRVGVFKGLARENSHVVWPILIKLLCEKMSYIIQTAYPQYMTVEHFPENRKIPIADYSKAVDGYLEIACSIVNGNLHNIEDLIRIMKNMSVSNQKKIIQAISNNLEHLSKREQEKVWNLLLDYINEQTKYPSRVNGSSEEGLQLVDQLVKRIIAFPKDAQNRRLFQQNQEALFQEKYGDTWEEERKKIQHEKEELVYSIYMKSGLQELLSFAHSVEQPLDVGLISGSIITEEELKAFIEEIKLPVMDSFIKGVLQSSGNQRILHILSNLPPDRKTAVLQCTILNDAAVEEVSCLNKNYRDAYWDSRRMGPYDLKKKENLEQAVRELCKHKDKEFGLMILSQSLKSDFSQLTSDFILSILQDFQPLDNHIVNEDYYIQKLFEWLYQQESLPVNEIILLELKYLPVINENPKSQPRFIYQAMSSEPETYATIIKWIHEEPKLLSTCYDLLNHWHLIPGTRSNGSIDGNALTTWYEKVKSLLDDENLRKTAALYFGQLLFYAPKDVDGFFVDRTVATILNSPEGDVLRHGYSAQAINSRGVHLIDYTGEAEYKLAQVYKERADAAEAEGYIRFAKILHYLASDYRQEGEDHKKEGEARRRLEQN